MKRPVRLTLLTSVGVLALCGCSAMVAGMVDTAVGQAKVRLAESAHEIIQEAVNNLPPLPQPSKIPEPGAPWKEYLAYFATVLAGSGLVLVDRRWFHNSPKRRP